MAWLPSLVGVEGEARWYQALLVVVAVICPNGHSVCLARLTCMARAGFYWCGECSPGSTYRAWSGYPAVGVYYIADACARSVAGGYGLEGSDV